MITTLNVFQTGIEPEFVLIFYCPEEEMERPIIFLSEICLSFHFKDLYSDTKFLNVLLSNFFFFFLFNLYKGREDDHKMIP